MWNIKFFDTVEEMATWKDENIRRYWWSQIFVENKWAVEYRPLRRI